MFCLRKRLAQGQPGTQISSEIGKQNALMWLNLLKGKCAKMAMSEMVPCSVLLRPATTDSTGSELEYKSPTLVLYTGGIDATNATAIWLGSASNIATSFR